MSTTRTRSYDYEVAKFDHASAMKMTGLEYMRAMVRGELDTSIPPISNTMNMFAPYNLEYGQVSVDAEPADFLMNPIGFIHGGFAATVLDTALGIAVHTALPAATGYTTAELSINYTRGINADTGRLRADGKLIHMGRRMATSEARLVGIDDGKLYAHGKTTCYVFPLQG